MKPLSSLVIIALLTFFAPISGHAQSSVTSGIPLRIWAFGTVTCYSNWNEENQEYNTGCGSIEVYGTFMPTIPGGSGYEHVQSPVFQYSDTGPNEHAVTLVLGTNGVVKVMEGTEYTLNISHSEATGEGVRFVPPPGYEVVVDKIVRSKVDFPASGTVVFQLRRSGGGHPSLAGLASSVGTPGIDWRLSLGSLTNGESAGYLRLIDPAYHADWSNIFNWEKVQYEGPYSDIIFGFGFVASHQIAVMFAPLSAPDVGYQITCYPRHRVLVQWNGGYWSMQQSGAAGPHLVYRIQKGATDTSLKITKIAYSNVYPHPAERTEVTTLERTGTAPAYTWTKNDWHVEGQTPVSETYVQGSGNSTSRSEASTVRTPNSGPTAITVSRGYQTTSGFEFLTSVMVGSAPGSDLIFQYFTDIQQPATFGWLQNAKLAGGKWLRYEYHDAGISLTAKTGQVKHQFSPHLNQSEGERVFYDYTNDAYGLPTRPSVIETRVNGVVTKKTTFDYVQLGGGVEELKRYDHVDASTTLLTVTRKFTDNHSDPYFSGKIRSITQPDGSKQVFQYVKALQMSPYDPPYIITVNGQSGNGTLLTDYGEPVHVTSTKSTMERQIFNRYSNLITRSERYVWSGSWQLVSAVDYTHDGFSGMLVGTTRSNGETTSTTYTGLLKASETDQFGTTRSFAYDAGGRVATVVQAASTNVLELKTRYTYDAAGNLLSEDIGPDGTGVERIINSKTYDTAGRVLTETPAGKGTITHSYAFYPYSASGTTMTHTVTRPKPFLTYPGANGGTIIEARYHDGRLLSRTGTGVVSEHYSYNHESDGRRWTRVDVGAPTSSRWTKSWEDWLGRRVRSERPGFSGAASVVEENFYNNTAGQTSTGHLSKKTEPGRAATLFAYATFVPGSLSDTGLDVDADAQLGGALDRGKGLEDYITSYSSAYWRKTTERKWYQNSTPYTSVSDARLTGHPAGRIDEVRSYDAEGNVTTVTRDVNLTTRTVTVTTTRTGLASPQIEKIENGLSIEVTGHDGVWTKTIYDALHRPWKRVDMRNNNTVETTYVNGTRLVQLVKEKANTASPGTVSTFEYDALGRKTSHKNANNKYTYFAYNLRDQVIRQWGAAAQPVSFAYNSYGEQIAMRTFRSPAQDFTTATWPLSDDGTDPYSPDPATWSTGDVTRWVCDAATGLLKDKEFPKLQPTDPLKKTSYTYNSAGQVLTREWARTVVSGPNGGQRVKASYTYDSATGEQTAITYNDGTPAVSFTYTRAGQIDSATDGASGVRDFVYDPSYPWRLYTEALDTFYGQRVKTSLYETSGVVGRNRGFRLGATVGSNSELEQTYGYATNGRFDSLTSGRSSNATTRTFRYGYETNSALLKTLWTDDNSFFITRSFEANRDVLTSVDTKWGASAPSSFAKFAYVTNNLGQRQSVEQSGDAFTGYGGTANTIHQTFGYNDRGEVTGAPTKLGTVASPGSPISDRQHEFDYDLIGNRKWAGFTGNSGDRKNYVANALNQYSSRDNSISPFTGTQSFSYDADGNVLDDGHWIYEWDGENRLIAMETKPAIIGFGISAADARRLEFRYDYLHRRVQKLVRNGWNGSSYATVLSQHRYLYDGWNPVAEYSVSGSTLTLTRSYTWGLDIARSLLDAGGVGALLQMTDHASSKSFHYAYDGNGNVAALVNGSNGAVAATYEYSPYGELIRNDNLDSTLAATPQPFRFSTKFTDGESGMVYYGRRYYSPSQGRFLGRDTIEERGGRNLYAFVLNNPINFWDVLGMLPSDRATKDATTTELEEIEDGVWAYVTYKTYSMGMFGGSDEEEFEWYVASTQETGPHGANPSAYGGTYTLVESKYTDDPALVLPGDTRFGIFQNPDGSLAPAFTLPPIAPVYMPPPESGALQDMTPMFFGGASLLTSGRAVLPAGASQVTTQGVNIAAHGMRHFPEAGRPAVEAAIRQDLATVGTVAPRQIVQRTITVGGEQITYRGFGLQNGTVNVGTAFPGTATRNIARRGGGG